jgi:hypothetical protein
MPIKYVTLDINGDHRDAKPTRVLTTIIIELENLQENRLEAQHNVGANQWSKFLWNQQKILRRSSNLEIMSYGFPKEKKHIWANLRKDGLVHLGYNIAYLIILLFLFLLTILNQTQYWSMLIN